MPSLGFGLHIFIPFLVLCEITWVSGPDITYAFAGSSAENVQNKFRNGAQKKVPESAGLVGGPRPSFGLDLIFKPGPKS